jgi:hypothetical protein
MMKLKPFRNKKNREQWHIGLGGDGVGHGFIVEACLSLQCKKWISRENSIN